MDTVFVLVNHIKCWTHKHQEMQDASPDSPGLRTFTSITWAHVGWSLTTVQLLIFNAKLQ